MILVFYFLKLHFSVYCGAFQRAQEFRFSGIIFLFYKHCLSLVSSKLHSEQTCQRSEKPNIRHKNFLLYAWNLLGANCLEKWISDPRIQVIPKQMSFDDLTNPATE